MFLKFFSKKPGTTEESKAEQVVKTLHGINHEMNYCPSCKDEYRSDISQCGACGIPLVSGRTEMERIRAEQAALDGRSMEILVTDELVNIRNGPLKDMKSLQKLLALERIPSILVGEPGGCAKGCGGPELILQIKKEHIPIATEILTRDFIKSTALDSHDLMHATAVFDQQAAETVCPACGCRFSPTVGACPECGLCFE